MITEARRYTLEFASHLDCGIASFFNKIFALILCIDRYARHQIESANRD